MGKEAYGYFNLANNFVGYAQVITVALNSMASRFITIKIHQKDDEGRNKYFSSVFIANAMISVLLMAVFSVIIVFLDRLFEISQNIVVDVKLLWCFVCVSFIINIIFNVFSVATFAKDRLDLASLRTIESNVIRAVLLAGIFGLCVPKVWYLGFVTFVTSIYIIIWNIHYTKTMLPGIKISKSLFDHEAIKSLLSSGLWNSFTQLSSILSTGLDLLITNIWYNRWLWELYLYLRQFQQ